MKTVDARIHVLAPEVANQIAAGEVVERPASVIKELVENSLDAGADDIYIAVEKAGMSRILIRDNGHGIHADDMFLAITAHATSKLNHLSDLQTLASLGFRGEALASIAAVADTSLISKHSNADKAWKISADKKLSLFSHPQGTTIEVNNLFARIPVRRRFLKSERTEWQQIEEIVTRIALSRFDVAFELRHNERKIFQLPPANTETEKLARVAKLVGNDFVKQSHVIDATVEGLHLSGWVSPQMAAHADKQYFFLNGRVVKDKLLNHAVRVAFQELAVQAHYPAYVLYLECAPSEIDINVHPTKYEVRFHQARWIHDFIVQALSKKLSEHSEENKTVTLTPFISTFETREHYKIAPFIAQDNWSLLFRVAEQYCFLQNQDQYWLLDFLAALRYWAEQRFNANAWVAQPLLFPLTITLTATVSENFIEQLADFCIQTSWVGPAMLQIKAVPMVLKQADWPHLLTQLAIEPKKEHWLALMMAEVNMGSYDTAGLTILLKEMLADNLSVLQQKKLIKCLTATELQKWLAL